MPTPSSLHRAAAWPSVFTPSRHTAAPDAMSQAMSQSTVPPITPPDVSITMLDLEQAFRADTDVAVFGPTTGATTSTASATTGAMTSALTLDRLTEVSRMLDAHHDNGAARLRTATEARLMQERQQSAWAYLSREYQRTWSNAIAEGVYQPRIPRDVGRRQPTTEQLREEVGECAAQAVRLLHSMGYIWVEDTWLKRPPSET